MKRRHSKQPLYQGGGAVPHRVPVGSEGEEPGLPAHPQHSAGSGQLLEVIKRQLLKINGFPNGAFPTDFGGT